MLAGGVGGSRFALGVRAALERRADAAAPASVEPFTVVVNTGDDLWLSGVRLQPDVDSIVYALAGVNDAERGWGRAGDSERVNHELQEWGAGWPWFTLGDLDLGTHLARTGWLRDGLTPTEVIARMSQRWPLGARLLPMTDAEVDTIVTVSDDGASGGCISRSGGRATAPPSRPLRFDNPGIEAAAPAPGVLEAIADADVVLIAPSNPVVSIGPILAVPGIREALRADARAASSASLRSSADASCAAWPMSASPRSASRPPLRRSPRTTAHAPPAGCSTRGCIAEEDAASAPDVEGLGIRPVVAPLWMRDAATSAALAEAALRAAEL